MDRPGTGPLPGPARPGAEQTAEQTARLALGSRTAVVQCSRDFCRQALRQWHWLPAADEEQLAVATDVVLMVSELVTNACLFAPGGPRELRLRWNGLRLRVEVADASPVPPRLLRRADRRCPSGYGLWVVDRLAGAWGHVPEGHGKVVWLEVPSPIDHHVRTARAGRRR
ncbi:ATP-binding protein [Kitasatospora sp. CM 4170]|uniref:ATP-binding protein n=1 Tax=Kitasatospora aburaviensis TaxID=67265 RepID=A0ABW1F742_9ACTN|nr:ATP-binding protein [Kitasatospora sp. CM 4170]WNM43566.1 ATP-binding protein [Kitasatospora sp. CM 4170]